MKAIIWTKYGPPEVLQLQEAPKPVPKDHEVLIRIHATTVTAGDCELRQLKLPFYYALPLRLYSGIRKPSRINILGQELSGEIEVVGKSVTRFQPGQAVFGTPGMQLGAYAEYICLPVEGNGGALALKPASLSHGEAAAVPVGGLEALHFLRQANIRRGESLLVNGAGGSIGTFAIQLALYYGAEVTAVDSGGKLDMLRALGAAHVIDYTKDDFTKNGQSYDVIFDVPGKSPFSASLRALKPGGRYLLSNAGLTQMARSRWASKDGKRVIYGTSNHNAQDLAFLGDLIEAGAIRPVIDRTYPLAQAADAHRYVETGQKKGGVVLTV